MANPEWDNYMGRPMSVSMTEAQLKTAQDRIDKLRGTIQKTLELLDPIEQAELRVFKAREWLRAALK